MIRSQKVMKFFSLLDSRDYITLATNMAIDSPYLHIMYKFWHQWCKFHCYYYFEKNSNLYGSNYLGLGTQPWAIKLSCFFNPQLVTQRVSTALVNLVIFWRHWNKLEKFTLKIDNWEMILLWWLDTEVSRINLQMLMVVWLVQHRQVRLS